MMDRFVRHAITASVLLVAALSATVSYVHIRDLADAHGGDRLTSALLPLLIDGTVAAMSCVMLRAARLDGVRTPWLARVMLAVSVGATLAANTAYGAAYGLSGALLWTLPAVMFVGCVEVSVAMVRRTRDSDSLTSPSPAETQRPASVSAGEVTPSPATSEPKRVTARGTSPHHRNDKLVRLLLSSPDMTEPEVARKAGCSVSSVARQKKRMREAAMANGHGPAVRGSQA